MADRGKVCHLMVEESGGVGLGEACEAQVEHEVDDKLGAFGLAAPDGFCGVAVGEDACLCVPALPVEIGDVPAHDVGVERLAFRHTALDERVEPVAERGGRLALLGDHEPVGALDVTGEGDEVVLFGAEPLAEDWAQATGTIGYEIVTRLGPRVERVYL